ncbi:hypothetical protein HDK77DRAFT_318768 [Phyllosticta capitalensis]|uniref:Uncharacterized protein n=1 Tax=Phyllosticta capitalensis TaxID=121624 RepID=A0ABR1YIQ3_9PEZI
MADKQPTQMPSGLAGRLWVDRTVPYRTVMAAHAWVHVCMEDAKHLVERRFLPLLRINWVAALLLLLLLRVWMLMHVLCDFEEGASVYLVVLPAGLVGSGLPQLPPPLPPLPPLLPPYRHAGTHVSGQSGLISSGRAASRQAQTLLGCSPLHAQPACLQRCCNSDCPSRLEPPKNDP